MMNMFRIKKRLIEQHALFHETSFLFRLLEADSRRLSKRKLVCVFPVKNRWNKGEQ